MYLNRVTLIGFTGKDAKPSSNQAGKQITRLSLATTRKWKDHNEKWQESTQWHSCVGYGPLADSLATLGKGAHVLIEGELNHREYDRTIETESGPIRVKWPVTEIVISSFRLLDRNAKHAEEMSAA